MKAMFKVFNDESEWEIFNNFINGNRLTFAKSRAEKSLIEKITSASWQNNTESRPDFISEDLMIEMFEVDDIVTIKKGKKNPQREANARAYREVEKFISEVGVFNEDIRIVATGDTRYDPETEQVIPEKTEEHHNYQAYINNFKRICQKHLDSLESYRENYPHKKLGFLIIDDATMYLPSKKTPRTTLKDAVYSLPYYDKNFMSLFVQSDVDFVIWAFNNKYLYINGDHGQNSYLPDIAVISKDNYYTKHSKYIDSKKMCSLEE
ncbi:hypothetical protein Hs20B_06700 [Lactococcus insecticola]|uniref:Uncharacterized protein n=1 Tax=Pseudolactococcus insecticola TaxID=2709158 RepID=A0A6A0B4Z1_9LACT|nr:hypothetical protein Hs20B_06700 [Lactococcus insecticola]